MTFNPFDLQKKMFEEFEKNLGDYLVKTMREPTFMKLVARNMETSLDLRGLIKEQTGKAMRALAIPTEDSMKGLYKTVHNVETRLLDLEEKVEDLHELLTAIASRTSTFKRTAKATPRKKAVTRKTKPAKKVAKPKRATKKATAKKAPAKKKRTRR